jgi:hypothetical protein
MSEWVVGTLFVGLLAIGRGGGAAGVLFGELGLQRQGHGEVGVERRGVAAGLGCCYLLLLEGLFLIFALRVARVFVFHLLLVIPHFVASSAHGQPLLLIEFPLKPQSQLVVIFLSSGGLRIDRKSVGYNLCSVAKHHQRLLDE